MTKAIKLSTDTQRFKIRGNYGGMDVHIDIPNEERAFGNDIHAVYTQTDQNRSSFIANDSLTDRGFWEKPLDFFDRESPIYHCRLRILQEGDFYCYASKLPILSKHGLQHTSMNKSMNDLLALEVSRSLNSRLFEQENRFLDFEIEKGTKDNPYILGRDINGRLLVFARGKEKFVSHQDLVSHCETIHGSIQVIETGFVDKGICSPEEVCAKLRFHGGTQDDRVAMMVEQQARKEYGRYFERMMGYE